MDQEKQSEQSTAANINDVKSAPIDTPALDPTAAEAASSEGAKAELAIGPNTAGTTSNPIAEPKRPVTATQPSPKPKQVKQPKEPGPAVMVTMAAIVFIVLCGLAYYAYNKK